LLLQQKNPEAEVWVIANAIRSVLKPIVTTCVMNYSRGHWLLCDASTIYIFLIVHMEAKFEHVLNGIKVQDAFNVELLLHPNM